MDIEKINQIIKIYKKVDSIVFEKKIVKLIDEFPSNHILYNLYGATLLDQNKIDLSIDKFKKSIDMNNNYAEAYNNLASAYLKKNNLKDAKKNFEKSIQIKSNFKLAKINLSNVYVLLGNKFLKNFDYSSAVYNYNKAIENNTNSADAHNNLGCVLEIEKKYDDAIVHFNKAISINPKYANSHYNLGNIFKKIGKFEKSISYLIEAIKIEPNYIEAYNNIGNIYSELGQYDEAIKYYKDAIKIKTTYENALNNLSNIFKDIGDYNEALKCYESLIKINPNQIKYKINKELMIMPIYQNNDEIKFFRDRYFNGIKNLVKLNYQTTTPGENIKSNLFYLAYHNHNNLEILTKTSKLFKKIIPNINFVSKKINNKNKNKIKIAFISEYLTYHSIGKIFGGFIKKINKEKFNISIVHTKDTKENLFKDKIDKYADKIIKLGVSIIDQQKEIEKESFDIIFYPDIGMSPLTYFLAHSRLAPVQVVSWGHTETSGIDTIDYFLSSKLFEDKKDPKMYSERLVCLSQFPTFYEPLNKIGKDKDRSDFNLPLNKNLYGCLQTFFKIHPNFDSILCEILKKDKDGYIVLASDNKKDKFWLKLLQKRWSKRFPILNQRTLILNKMPYSDYMHLCKCLDVLLIPPHFSSGTTTLETMIFGTPNITLKGDNLRSRLSSAVYKQMRLLDAPIANNVDEYINLAVLLAQDKKKNQSMRNETIKAAKKYLYENQKVIDEFERFLIDAHNANRLGKKIDDGFIYY